MLGKSKLMWLWLLLLLGWRLGLRLVLAWMRMLRLRRRRLVRLLLLLGLRRLRRRRLARGRIHQARRLPGRLGQPEGSRRKWVWRRAGDGGGCSGGGQLLLAVRRSRHHGRLKQRRRASGRCRAQAGGWVDVEVILVVWVVLMLSQQCVLERQVVAPVDQQLVLEVSRRVHVLARLALAPTLHGRRNDFWLAASFRGQVARSRGDNSP